MSYRYFMEYQRDLLKGMYPKFKTMKPGPTYELDSKIVERAMKATEEGRVIQKDHLESIRRIRKMAEEEFTIFKQDLEDDLWKHQVPWDTHIEDLLVYKQRLQSQRQQALLIRSWEQRCNMNINKMAVDEQSYHDFDLGREIDLNKE